MSKPQLVVGVAGHIDHGKSALVRALTGIDPDRLPEERARGMTIDLGFAHTSVDDCDLWFVDVPGHERFIRNMVAGATGVSFSLLVVAADDSIMPQTREHAEALALLGVESCGLVLTKMDLVDAEWADAVEQEARELLQTIGLKPSWTARVSAPSGEGIPALLRLLAGAARAREKTTDRRRWFRMPIDRSFLVPGRGVIVTGSVLHGAIDAGAELDLWPAGRRVRARDLQTHNQAREQAGGTMRLAINIPGITLDDAQRGFELATPDYLAPAACLDARLTWLRAPGKRLRRRLRLRLHIATRDTLVEVRLAETPDGREVRDAWAQLIPADPLVAAWGQRFLLRDEAATRTLGGGVVTRPRSARWTAKTPPDIAALEIIRAGKPRERLEQVVRLAGLDETHEARRAAEAGLNEANEARSLLAELARHGVLVRLEAGTAVMHAHVETLETHARRLESRLDKWLDARPRAAGVPLREWPAWMPRRCPDKFRAALAEWLLADGRFVAANQHVTPAARTTAITDADRTLLTEIIAALDAGGFQPPALDEVIASAGRDEKRARELLEYGLASGALVRVSDTIWFSAPTWRALGARVIAAIQSRGPLSMSELKNELGTTRKYAVPLIEKLDALGVTRRQGDARVLGPAAANQSSVA